MASIFEFIHETNSKYIIYIYITYMFMFGGSINFYLYLKEYLKQLKLIGGSAKVVQFLFLKYLCSFRFFFNDNLYKTIYICNLWSLYNIIILGKN